MILPTLTVALLLTGVDVLLIVVGIRRTQLTRRESRWKSRTAIPAK